MTRKIHLRANKLTGSNMPFARCSARRIGQGKVTFNSRGTYRFMASEIVSWDEFKATARANRCAHCMDQALILLNRKRKEIGKEPLAALPWDQVPA